MEFRNHIRRRVVVENSLNAFGFSQILLDRQSIFRN
jgi:hypothetical protein